MGKKSKRYRASLEKQPKTALPLEDAVNTLKKYDSTKFDQTVEIHIRLGVDPNQSDQIIRGSLVLPNGIGKTQRVPPLSRLHPSSCRPSEPAIGYRPKRSIGRTDGSRLLSRAFAS